jgi:hydrocephalus-inducing protein
MQFRWRVDNGTMPVDEFNIIPGTGAILPGVHQQFLVEFIPRNVAKYDSQIILDVPKVKNGVVSIAATGESVVPRLALSHEVLDFGQCFLQHDYILGMVISNAAKLPVQFQIEPQDDISVALARFTSDPHRGVIAAQGAAASYSS